MEYVGFFKKGTANISYIYNSDGTVDFRDYYYKYYVKKGEAEPIAFSLPGYKLVIKGWIRSVGESHIQLGTKWCNIKPASLVKLIQDKKTIRDTIYLCTAKNSGGAFWEYISESALTKLKVKPIDSLMKDDKMIKVLSNAGWSKAKIQRKLDEKAKPLPKIESDTK